MRQRWLGSSGLRVPQIAIEGEDVELLGEGRIRAVGATLEATVLGDVSDADALRSAHERGVPVVVRARTPEQVHAALSRPEVSTALVPPDERHLLDLDLVEMTYG